MKQEYIHSLIHRPMHISTNHQRSMIKSTKMTLECHSGPNCADQRVGIKESDKALLQKELCIYPSMVFIYSKVKESSRIINLRTINNHNNETTNDQNHQHVNHQEIDEIRLQKHHSDRVTTHNVPFL